MTRILLALLSFYRRWLSPLAHSVGTGGCKFQPTCSEYAEEAIAIHGPLKGCALAAARLIRCHPFTRGGFDPVPITPKRNNHSSANPVPTIAESKSAAISSPTNR